MSASAEARLIALVVASRARSDPKKAFGVLPMQRRIAAYHSGGPRRFPMPPLALTHTINAAWMLNAAILGLFIQVGFALLTCGLVRRKNAAHLVMLSLSAYAFSFLAYYVAGYAFQFGGVSTTAPPTSIGGAPTLSSFLIGSGSWGMVGGRGFFFITRPGDVGTHVLAMFYLTFMLVAAYILVGAICERVTFWAFVLCELFLAGILYPIFGCWVWGGGWLSQLGSTLQLGHGYVDFAGSSVVHELGGFCAMALAVVLGPRLGKYGPDGRPRPFPAHNVVFVVVGTLILLFGWIGMTVGSAVDASELRIADIAININLAAVAGAASAMLFWHFSYGKPDISMACNGLLAGLVAVSASCVFIGPNAAVVIGILAGLLVCGGVLFNERVLKIDDPCGSVAVHGYCGWFGAVAVGLFADGTYGAGWNGIGPTTYLGTAGQGVTGLLYGDVRQIAVQLGGATLCAMYAFLFTYVVFKVADRFRPMRVDPDVEIEGLDLPEFGMLAFPEDEN
jgi:Amt family ammonium transporter